MTQRFFQKLKEDRENFKEAWANAEFVSSHDKADVYQNAGAIASCSVLQKILEIEASDIFGDAE